MNGFDLVGYVASAFNIASFSMRAMIPLRIMAILSNCTFIAYAGFAGVYPILVMHMILLPLNVFRLREMLRLVANVREAAHGDLRVDWLKPFMSRRRYAKGDVLFRQGDTAKEMFFILSGSFRVRELGIDVGTGQLTGELGLLAPRNRRSQTLECTEDGEVLTIGYEEVRQLYFQNPEFGFYFLGLTSQRLFQNTARLEEELARLHSGGQATLDAAETIRA